MTKRLKLTHTTRYDFDAPVDYGLLQLRKTPRSTRNQRVVNWSTAVEGGTCQLGYDDHHGNAVALVEYGHGTTFLELRSEGEVEVEDTHGVLGPHAGHVPLWLYRRSTDLTRAGRGCRDLLRGLTDGDEVARLHALSASILSAVTYETGRSETHWSAERVIEEGHGVCQDHAHVFLACARALGHPARYVSGYLMMDDRGVQEAMHAWAEAHVDGLGWVGFDVSNGISPDSRYVRVAVGLDYAEAAPVTGTRFGAARESLSVALEVTQQ